MQVAGLLGVVAGACFIAAFVLDPTPPVAGARGADVLSHGVAFSGANRAAAFLFAASGALLIAFLSGLRELLRSASPGPSWVGTAMLAGGIEVGTLLASTSVLFFTVASRTDVEGVAQARLLSDLSNYGFVFVGFGVMLMVVAAIPLMIRARGALRVLGELGIVVALLLIPYLVTAFFTSGAFVAGGVVTIIGFSAAGAWVGLTSLALLLLEPRALYGGASGASFVSATHD